MNKGEQGQAAPWQPARYLRRGALKALWLLEICPLVPVDAFVHLAGLSSQSGAYQQSARLRHAGLAIARRVDPGYLMGERPLGCWTITDKGRRVLGLPNCHKPGDHETLPRLRSSARVALNRPPGESDAPLLLATYRMLAALVLERRARGQSVEVQQLEWPWVRERVPTADGTFLRVRMPGGAILRAREPAVNSDGTSERLTQVLLIPDLGTAPVVRYREMLRRVATTLQEEIVLADSYGELEVVIATPDPDSLGSRRRAWLELLNRAGCRQAECSLLVRVLTWDWVAEKMTPVKSADALGDGRSGIRIHEDGWIGA